MHLRYDDYVSPPVETRGFSRSGLLKDGCMQCQEPHRWLDYRSLHIDGRIDELAFYLEDAAHLRSDAVWQQRPYNPVLHHEYLPQDDHNPAGRDYNPNDPPIGEGPLKLNEHRELVERMEHGYSGRGIKELQDTWLDHHYNDLIEDAADDENHPAYPYEHSGFYWEPPMIPEEPRYRLHPVPSGTHLAGAQFEEQQEVQMQAQSEDGTLQRGMELEEAERSEEEEEYDFLGEGTDPIQEYGHSDPYQRFFHETSIGSFRRGV